MLGLCHPLRASELAMTVIHMYSDETHEQRGKPGSKCGVTWQDKRHEMVNHFHPHMVTCEECKEWLVLEKLAEVP